MNKEEYPIDNKTFSSTDGTPIIIIHSNLGRRYRKIGTKLYLMPDPISAKLEDSITEMVRLQKENADIDQKLEIEKIRLEAKKEIEQLKYKQQLIKEEPTHTQIKIEPIPEYSEPETSDSSTKIQEMEKELAILKQIYAQKVQARLAKQNEKIKKEKEIQLAIELES